MICYFETSILKVSALFWARLHKWTFSERKEEEEEGRKKGKKNAACLLGALFAIPFPMHLVCVCAERERGSEGGVCGGVAVWGRLITSDL